MNKTLKKLTVANVIVLIAAVCFIIVSKYFFGREEYICNFYALTHMYCPGCGGTRAVYSLMRLDIVSSLRYNITVPFGIFVYIYYNIRGYIAAFKNNVSYFENQKYKLCTALAVVLVLNFVIKNLLLVIWGIDIMPTP